MENLKAKATNYVPESISFSEGYLWGLIKPDLGYIMMADWDKAKGIYMNNPNSTHYTLILPCNFKV